MNKFLGIVGILAGVGFGVLAVEYGDFLPQAKIPFLIFAVVMVAGGIALFVPWGRLMGAPETLPDEAVEEVQAKNSPTGRSIVRIPLDGAESPVKNQRCYLEASPDSMTLTNSDGDEFITFPIEEAITRIHFPSFWSTSFLKIDSEAKDLPYFFHPKKEAVERVRQLIDRSLLTHPEKVIATMRRKGWVNLLVGAGCLLLGIALTLASLAWAPANGRFYIMTGLIGVGTLAVGRGVYWILKASRQALLVDQYVSSEK
jgi:hypothetical protein